MILGIDPKVDYAFKLLLGRDETAPILIDVLNAVLQRPDGERVESVELLNPFNPKEAADGKLSVVDVRARDQSGRLFNVEMQMLGEDAFADRVVYYAAKTFTQQLHEGDGYDLLRPTIAICFLNHVLFPDATEYRSCFRLLETARGSPLTDALEFHFFELPKFGKREDELGGAIEEWLYFLRHAEMMDVAAVPAALQRSPLLQALGVLEMVSKSEIERLRYEDSREAERWREHNLRASEKRGRMEGEKIGRLEGEKIGRQEGRQEGEKIGRQEGEKIGRQEGERIGREEGERIGRQIGKIQLLERLLAQPETPAERLGRLSLDELDQMTADLERRFQQGRG